MMRTLDDRILKQEFRIEYLEYEVTSLKMMEMWIDKM